MCSNGLMVSESEFRYGDLRSFFGRGGYKFTFQFFFRIIMKKQWVGNRRKRFYGEMLENVVRGGGTCKNM